MTVDGQTQNGSQQNGVLQSKEEATAGAPNRIAHTLTACCRCRTVSTIRAKGTGSPDMY